MKRKILASVAATALLVFALASTAQGAKHKTNIYANFTKSSTSGYVFGSVTSPYDKCKKGRIVTASYTSTVGQPVSLSTKTDKFGAFRFPHTDPTGSSSGVLDQPPASAITITVKKKRVRPFDEKHICKSRSGTAISTQ